MPSVLDDPAVSTMLRSISLKENFQNAEISIDKGADKGDGYLSQISMVQIISKEKPSRKLNLIIKCAHTDPIQRSTFPTHQVYLREIRFYEKVMPAFKKFQSERQANEPFCKVPKYYDACSDESKEFLIMENIREDGYKLLDRKLPMDEEHIFLVLKQYAKMHAISFAMKKQEPIFYDKLSDGLDNLSGPKYTSREFYKSFELAADKASKLFNNGEEKKYADKMKDYGCKVMDFFHMLDGISHWEYSVITHGDGWLNNMMFKYSHQNNKRQLIDLRLYDFQMMRNLSPVLDMSKLIYMNSDVSLYDDYERCLKYYHKHLIEHGKALGTNIENIYSYETLKSEWIKYGQHGLFHALIGIGMLLQEKEDMVDLSDMSNGKMTAANVFFVDIKSDEVIRRMRNVVMHFVDNNFI